MSEHEHYPELVFGIVGPLGCDLNTVQTALNWALSSVGYESHSINLTDRVTLLYEQLVGKPFQHEANTIAGKIELGTALRSGLKSNRVFASEAIRRIKTIRPSSGDSETPPPRIAYVIRQFKRPEEVHLLSEIYGDGFIQVSVTESYDSRLENLVTLLRRQDRGKTVSEAKGEAIALIERDEEEKDTAYGQLVSETFPLGDVFISSENKSECERTTSRFIQALFGKNDISPTKDEVGAYFAKSASFRSVDLSRQVGATIVTQNGEIISTGFNDVPKPLGGQYWEEDEHKYRDIDIGFEANKDETDRILYDLLSKLQEAKIISDDQSVSDLLGNEDLVRRLKDSRVSRITEYGRMVHAEMSAITEAARLGRSLKDAIMYVTTFPCHNCAKHIIASGIKRIVYIEPYSKSLTNYLYQRHITDGGDHSDRVIFKHFTGIAPKRYQSIFEKTGKRRSADGKVQIWYEGKRAPRVRLPSEYLYSEDHAVAELIKLSSGRLLTPPQSRVPVRG